MFTVIRNNIQRNVIPYIARIPVYSISIAATMSAKEAGVSDGEFYTN